jgi:restriction endonuclease S subunit
MRESDLLLKKSGGSPDQPVGRIAILNDSVNIEEPLAFSNFIQKFRVDQTRINSDYLFCFLRTMHSIGVTDAMQSQTNGIRNLIMREYWNQYIPLPPIGEQKRIAEQINAIRQQAQALRQQAQDNFAKAKQEIEQMILG